MDQCKQIKLKLVSPDFGSDLSSAILELRLLEKHSWNFYRKRNIISLFQQVSCLRSSAMSLSTWPWNRLSPLNTAAANATPWTNHIRHRNFRSTAATSTAFASIASSAICRQEKIFLHTLPLRLMLVQKIFIWTSSAPNMIGNIIDRMFWNL